LEIRSCRVPALLGVALLLPVIASLPAVLADPFPHPPLHPLAALDPPAPASPLVERPASGAEEVRFGEHIRPILSNHCFECHGPDVSTRKADLRLDLREEAIADRGGYAAIVPGDVEGSELWLRITTDHGADRMPPVATNRRALTDEEKGRIRSWIESGAEYEEHWAWVPPERGTVPAVRDAAWGRSEVDDFVLAALERQGVRPSPPATPLELVRRLYLDVTGLPPTPEEIDRFLADSHANATEAYEREVDRLLGEEPYVSRFAEHWATSWLDASRYGDTSGIHMDAGRQIWLWRDWVMKSLRDNLPYDRFIVEQIAGDLLPEATTEQVIASGFNRNHVTTDEGGSIAAEALVEYAVDRVDTTSAVFLGLTAGCARCHDHKYDPISQEEYYQLFAFFNSVEEPGLYGQSPNPNRALEPFIEVPTEEQETSLEELAAQAKALQEEMESVPPEEAEERRAFTVTAKEEAGIAWTIPELIEARSTDARVTLEPQEDLSLIARGPHPEHEDYQLHLKTSAVGQRLLLIEALKDPARGSSVGRADHHNVVVSRITLGVRPAGSTGDFVDVPLRWAWADHSQSNLDYDITNAIRDDKTLGWAANGHQVAGQRMLCLLTELPFGEEGGTELMVGIEHQSVYARHSLARVRVRVSPITDAGIAALPPHLGRWHVAGPYKSANRNVAYDDVHGPESLTAVTTEPFAEGRAFAFDGSLRDDAVVRLKGGIGSSYLGRTIFSPDARTLDVALGSDDGYRLFVNGEEIAGEKVDRGAALGQSQVAVPLKPGPNSLILKIVNTGGITAYAFEAKHAEGVLVGEIAAALMPLEALGPEQEKRFEAEYRRRVSPSYRAAEIALASVRESEGQVRDAIARTMVMKDLETPRDTFVLMRGQYDQPDKERKVEAAVPAVLGRLPEGAPRNRLGLAQWMVAPENPLVARVAVNRCWQMLFGTGLVRTAEDLGLQGEWPSHPELLDWLAVEFREGGWDWKGLIRSLLTSSTYRQQSRVRPELADLDPDNRLLGHFPRHRLTAEQIRDTALYTSGLLVEEFGGPSVKPYQPPGLWREVAMLASNTRIFERGEGEALWRRSLYTYWKRAAPPPSLLTLDAPTREACVIRRTTTNTPLQALVLWNDEQFVEAARILAERTLRDGATDAERITTLMRRCTGRVPGEEELALLGAALAEFRARYAAAPEDATALLAVGEAPMSPDFAAEELAAWTLLASAVLNLHETITQD